MKRKLRIFSIFMILILFCSPNVCLALTDNDYKISLYAWDAEFQTAVRNALTLADGKDRSIGYIYKSDFNKIEELSIDYNKVRSIRGIERLSNLKTLKIYTNGSKKNKTLYERMERYTKQGSSRRSLPYLNRIDTLEKIDLSDNEIEDITDLAKILFVLTNVDKFDLSNNKIKDISDIGYLKNLKELNLSNNKINNISILSRTLSLEKLDISNNLVQNIYPLRYLKKLKSLNISGNNIENLYPLESCSKLEELYMNGNIEFKDIVSDKYIEIIPDNVIDSTKLKINGRYIRIYSEEWNDNYTVYNNRYIIYKRDYAIYNDKPVDITPIGAIKSLKKLDLSSNYITSIYPLKNLINLEYLNINNNHINDISYIENMTKLKELDVKANDQIDDIKALENLTNLETLNMSDNNINDIFPIKNLTKLKYLDLSHNNISNIDPIEYISPHEDTETGENLTGLIELKLNDNRIENIYGLIGLTNLEKLYLQNEDIDGSNYINDSSPLKNLPNIKEVILPNK